MLRHLTAVVDLWTMKTLAIRNNGYYVGALVTLRRSSTFLTDTYANIILHSFAVKRVRARIHSHTHTHCTTQITLHENEPLRHLRSAVGRRVTAVLRALAHLPLTAAINRCVTYCACAICRSPGNYNIPPPSLFELPNSNSFLFVDLFESCSFSRKIIRILSHQEGIKLLEFISSIV